MYDSASTFMLHNQQALSDQRDRAEYLAKKIGHEPTSWYEFSQSNASPKRSLALRTTVGVAIGAMVGVGAKLIASKYFSSIGSMGSVAIIGGTSTVGGLLGGLSAIEEEGPRQELINKYKLYLDDFERSVAPQQSKSQMVDEKSEVKKLNQVERVQTSRQQVADHTPSI